MHGIGGAQLQRPAGHAAAAAAPAAGGERLGRLPGHEGHAPGAHHARRKLPLSLSLSLSQKLSFSLPFMSSCAHET